MQVRNNQKNAPVFEKVAQVKGGHSLWRDPQGRIAVADNSMRQEGRPDTTNDGLLYVDFSRPVVVGPDSITIPLVSPSGERTATVGPGAEMLLLADLGVEIQDERGRVIRKGDQMATKSPTGLRGLSTRSEMDVASANPGRKIRFFGIDYNTDQEDGSPVKTAEELGLLRELVIAVEADFDVEEDGADLLSEKTGWLVNGFQHEEVEATPAQAFSPTLKDEGLQAMLSVRDRFMVGQQVEILLDGGKVQDGVVAGFGCTSNVYDLDVDKAWGLVLVDIGEGGFYSPDKAVFNRLMPVAPEYVRPKEV